MSWSFETDPEYQETLDWVDQFVREEIEPIDLIWGDMVYHQIDGDLAKIVFPLKQAVKDKGLWACHLTPDLGGQGFGQVKLALMNEILGRSPWAPIIFGCQAPDSGNAEIIARFGTEEQKERYLRPLLDGDIFSCYSMTEPQSGSDPKEFTTLAVRDGDEWVLEGWKFFSSHADDADLLIVMAVTDPDVSAYKGMSMFLVPRDTPGVEIVRRIGTKGEPIGSGPHTLLHYDQVRLPADALLGEPGNAFVIAQTRLGGGRVHHAMRTIGLAQRAFDMMCERALSRRTQGGPLADKQLVQAYVADSFIQIEQFRLIVLYTAWLIDEGRKDEVRRRIAAIKVATPQLLHEVVSRAMQVHGALGVSNELPLMQMFMRSAALAVVDGPTEVHKITIARQTLSRYQPAEGLWPSEHLPAKIAAAQEKFAGYEQPEQPHPHAT